MRAGFALIPRSPSNVTFSRLRQPVTCHISACCVGCRVRITRRVQAKRVISGAVSTVGGGWRVRLECHGSKIGSDGGPLPFRELDETPGLHDIAGGPLGDPRSVHNRLHSVVGLLRQPVFGRSAGYDDVNDADRPALDPVMRQVVGGRGVDAEAASAGRMGRFETGVSAATDNRGAPADVSGQWIDRGIDRAHAAMAPEWITPDMDGSVGPPHGAQEGTAWNGHFGCMCRHPLFVLNRFGCFERRSLRLGNVHSADGRENVLKPVLARYADRELMRLFRADAALAVPELYKTPEAEGCSYAVRPGKTAVPESRIAPVLKRPADRPPTHVRGICGDFAYQAASRDKPRRVVTNPPMEPDRIIRFYNQRGTAEQHIEEGRQAINRTRLSCKGMRGTRCGFSFMHWPAQSRCLAAGRRSAGGDGRPACGPASSGSERGSSATPEPSRSNRPRRLSAALCSPASLRPSNGSVRHRYRAALPA